MEMNLDTMHLPQLYIVRFATTYLAKINGYQDGGVSRRKTNNETRDNNRVHVGSKRLQEPTKQKSPGTNEKGATPTPLIGHFPANHGTQWSTHGKCGNGDGPQTG
jgi:hypothetical protein